jgi:hypothetical protein
MRQDCCQGVPCTAPMDDQAQTIQALMGSLIANPVVFTVMCGGGGTSLAHHFMVHMSTSTRPLGNNRTGVLVTLRQCSPDAPLQDLPARQAGPWALSDVGLTLAPWLVHKSTPATLTVRGNVHLHARGNTTRTASRGQSVQLTTPSLAAPCMHDPSPCCTQLAATYLPALAARLLHTPRCSLHPNLCCTRSEKPTSKPHLMQLPRSKP